MGDTTATRADSFNGSPVSSQNLGFVRGAWLLSNGREVLLTLEKCYCRDGARIYSAPYPLSAGAGLAVQCVMATKPGWDPFLEQNTAAR